MNLTRIFLGSGWPVLASRRASARTDFGVAGDVLSGKWCGNSHVQI